MRLGRHSAGRRNPVAVAGRIGLEDSVDSSVDNSAGSSVARLVEDLRDRKDHWLGPAQKPQWIEQGP